MTLQGSVDLDSRAFAPSLGVDSWLSETFGNQETDFLTRALQLEICNSDSSGFISSSDIVATPTNAPSSDTDGLLASISSGTSVPWSNTSIQDSASLPAGKTTRKKPRKSKKSPITVINTDAANFRQMVQQITGTRCPIAFGSSSSIFRPEPKRPRTALLDVPATSSSVLPTLDTSAFLLNQAGSARPETFSDTVTIPQTSILDFGSFQNSFPTLESCSHPFVSFLNQMV